MVEPIAEIDESNEQYRLRREREDQLKLIAEHKVTEEISKLKWRYGSIIAGFAIGLTLLGYSQISDIPNKIESAMNSETTLAIIDQIKVKGKEVDTIYTDSFNLLSDLQKNRTVVVNDITKHLKQDSNFQKRIKGSNGDPGTNGKDGVNGKDGINGINGTDGKDSFNAGIIPPEQIGRFEVLNYSGDAFLTFTDLTPKKDIKFAAFILGSGFDPKIKHPPKTKDKFSFKVTSLKGEFEATAIIYYKNKNQSLPTPYLYNVIVKP